MREFNWESVGEQSRRAKTPTGWIVNTWSYDYDGNIVCESMCFVPDEKHEWILEEK